MTLYPLQCLFGIPVSCGRQRVIAEALKYCNILPGFQKIYLLLTFCRPSGFLKLIFFEKKIKFQMPLSAVLKWFRPLFWLGWKETLLLNKIHWFWACLCHKISQQVALSHATSVWKTRIVKGLVLRVKMCEHLTNYKFLTEIWSIFKEITNNLTTKNFSLVNNPLLTWRFSKTDIFCEKSSNYKRVYPDFVGKRNF